MTMLLFLLLSGCVSLLGGQAANSCSADFKTCSDQMDGIRPRMRNKTYEECRRTSSDLVARAHQCVVNKFTQVSADKTCGCSSTNLGQGTFALLSESVTKHAPGFFCTRSRDTKLPGCPPIVERCERLAKQAARESNIWKFGETCSARQLESKNKLLQCFDELVATDLSKCGSLKHAVAFYAPFVRVLFTVYCSGCDIVSVGSICGRNLRSSRPRRHPCRGIDMADTMAQCMNGKLQSGEKCRKILPTLKQAWQDIKTKTMVKVLYDACEKAKKYDTEYAGWGCAGGAAKRDSPTWLAAVLRARRAAQPSLLDAWSSLMMDAL